MLSMACCMCVTVFSWPNLNSGMGLVEKRTAPTRDCVLEIGSVTTMDLIKLSISLKLPRPWYSMLPEPSIRNPTSTTVLQAVKEECKSYLGNTGSTFKYEWWVRSMKDRMSENFSGVISNFPLHCSNKFSQRKQEPDHTI